MNKLQTLWTVDVEDYYMSPESITISTWNEGIFEDRIAVGCNKLLELFSKHNVKATWFFLGWVAEKHPELVRAAFEQGHEIATHTYDHRAVHALSPDEYETSLKHSCDILESITGEKVVGHRAPEWSIKRDMPWAIEIMRKQGLLYDSSINPVATYLYGDKSAPRFPYKLPAEPALWEVPPGSVNLLGKTVTVGGGFFLRALPVAYMMWAIKRYNKENRRAVIYIHPWELDPEHSVPQMPHKERLIHCWGLNKVERKMEKLLAISDSMPIKNYLENL